MSQFGEPLSQREQEVLQCVAEGATNKEIAFDLSISQNTVKVHLRNIFNKLGVSSRTEATTVAIQQGVLAIPGSIATSPVQDDVPAVATTLDDESDPVAGTQAIPPDANSTSETQATGESTTTTTAPRSFPRRTLIYLVFLLATIAAIGLVYLSQTARPSPTPEPFEEIPLGDTNWLQSRPMDGGRAHMAAAAVGLDIYLIGGQTDEGTTGSAMAYDTIGRSWQAIAVKPTAVSDASAEVLFGEIYVPGGRLADGSPTAIVEAYSPTNEAWRTITSLPQPVAGGLALSDGSFLYLLGGWNGEEYLNTAYVYDVVAESWRPLPSLNQGRAYAAGRAVTGRLYVVGGYDGRTELASCEYFDTALATWFDCPDMLLPRAGAGAAAVLNKLYVIGGGMDGRNAISYSEVYDPNSETWQVVNTPMLGEDSTWVHLGVTSVEVRIYALGGQREGTLSPDNFIYSPRVYRTFIPSASTGPRD